MGYTGGVTRTIRPGPPPEISAAGRTVVASYSNGAGTRAYEVYAPPPRTPGPRPLLVMLHGCAQGPADFAAGTRMNALADLHDFVVVYPAQSTAANPMRCWNWFNVQDQWRDQGEPSLIAGIARQVTADHALDAGRLCIAGFSAGGAMAVIVAQTHAEMFAALGVHSGLPYGAAQDAASALAAMQGGTAAHGRAGARGGSAPPVSPAIPTIVFHGDADATVNVGNGAEIVRRAVAREVELHGVLHAGVQHRQAAGGREYTVTEYRGDAAQPLIEYWVVHGAGHAWSGGSSGGGFTDLGGPDASAEMVRFLGLSAPRATGRSPPELRAAPGR